MPVATEESTRKRTHIKDFNLDKEGQFTAVFSTFNVVDHQGDLVLPGAFGEQRVIVSGYGHASWNSGVDALPVGKGRIFERGNEAIIVGEFFLNTIAGKETYLTVKNVGDLQEFSYALPEIDFEYRDVDGQRVRALKKIRVNEVSPVLLAASIGTRLLEIKCSSCANRGGCATCPKREEKAAIEKLFLESETRRLAYQLKRQEERNEIRKVFAESRAILSRPLPEIGYRYREIEAGYVDLVVRKAAERVLASAWDLLGAPWPVRLVWVAEESAADRESLKLWGERFWKSHFMEKSVGGFASPGGREIFILKTDAAWAVKRTVAHELAHLVQPSSMDDAECEYEAESFAGSWPVHNIR